MLNFGKAIFAFLFVLMTMIFFTCPSIAQNQNVEATQKGQTVAAVAVDGNHNVPSEQILEMVSTKIGDAYDENKLRHDVQSIYDLGFFTDVKANTVPAEKGVKIIFLITENPIVKEIDIEGASLIPSSTLQGLMKTVPGKILNTRTLYGDVLVINEHYSNEGYTDPSNHVANLTWTKDGKVLLKIQEGIAIKAIELKGNTIYPTARLRGMIHARVGEIFNRKKIEEDLGRIATLYKDDGYSLSGLKGNIQPDGTVVVEITETVIESMRLEGNKKTRPYVVYHYIRTKIGSVLNKNRVKKDLERLQNTGYFSDVNVEPEEGTEPGKVVLVWKLKEARTGTASVGLGYSGAVAGVTPGGLTGAITVSEKNISGTGQGASLTWQRGVNVSQVSVGYTNPFIDKADDSVAVNYFNSSYFNLNQVVPGSTTVFTNNPLLFQFGNYSEHESGANISIGRPVFDEDTHLFLTGLHENVSASALTIPFSNTILPFTQGTVNAAGVSMARDTRDDIYDTYRGSYYSAGFTRAGKPFGGNFNYDGYQGELRKYVTLREKYTLAFRTLVGVDQGNVPITNWFVLGGPDTLRGYTLDSFIGTRMLLGNAEFRFPLGKQKMFRGAVFYDTGMAWQPGQNVNLGQLQKDYGIGIRLKLPQLGLGVIRLDFALGGSQGSRTAIGIGQSF